jgi:hypothetical protein
MLLPPGSALAAEDEGEEAGGGGSEEGESDEGGAGDEEATEEAEEEEEKPVAKPKGKRSRGAPREVVKGFFARIQIGPTIWVPPISSFTSGVGTTSHFAVGYDFVDTLRFTMAFQAAFFQLVTNGNGTYGGFVSPIQGDFRIFGGVAGLRLGPNFGGQKARRLNFSVIVLGGVGGSPLLVEETSTSYQDTLAAFGAIMQGRPLGLVSPGVGLEYYTKLAHFSLGLDVTADMILGGPMLAIAVSPNVFLKYTF